MQKQRQASMRDNGNQFITGTNGVGLLLLDPLSFGDIPEEPRKNRTIILRIPCYGEFHHKFCSVPMKRGHFDSSINDNCRLELQFT